jgi:hypothetical protein
VKCKNDGNNEKLKKGLYGPGMQVKYKDKASIDYNPIHKMLYFDGNQKV